VLYAGLLAKSYAPDLDLVGIAAAAPATDLGTLLRDDIATPGGKNLLAMTLWSWSRVFGAPINSVVDPAALATIDKLANDCLESPVDIEPRAKAAKEREKRFLKVDNLTDLEPWRGLLAQNTIGTLPSSIPIFLLQGTADTTILPAVTDAYAARLCGAGSRVDLVAVPGVGHGMIAVKTSRTAVSWIADRFGGARAPSTCRG
jgi:pimeloyl-ACP methyl ester carboxylesterase